MNNNRQITIDQQFTLDRYFELLRNNNRQIDHLLDIQNEIHMGIHHILQTNSRTTEPHRHPTHNHNTPERNHVPPPSSNTAREPPISNMNTQTLSTLTPLERISDITNMVDTIYSNRLRLYNNLSNSYRILSFVHSSNEVNDFNSNVVVAPSHEQISVGTEELLYGDIDNPISTVCPITLEDFNNTSNITRIIPCGHIFMRASIARWFTTNVKCPVCRIDIRDYQSNNQIDSEYNGDNEHNGDNGDNEDNEDNDPARDDLQDITTRLIRRLLNTSNTSSSNSEEVHFTNSIFDSSNNEIIFTGFVADPNIFNNNNQL